jgi:SAM-dependent methyltransferase
VRSIFYRWAPDNTLMNIPYSSKFYAIQQAGSFASADIVVPHVLSLFRVSSVLDVGCGVGGWLQVFERHGITDYFGVDGDYIPLEMLKIPAEKFRPMNIANHMNFRRSFDLACSLEVAEHLPAECAEQFVEGLVKAAPVVLFSAAIPCQGGTAHLNEQWPTYWAALFARHGYVAVDCIRPWIYGNQHIDWWYRQNILIFCQGDKCPKGYQPTTNDYDLNRVDPGMIEHLLTPGSISEALRDIRRVLPYLWRFIVWRVGFKTAPVAKNRG